MRREGTVFRAGVERRRRGRLTGAELRERYDAVVLATGATEPRDLPVPGPRARPASTRRWSTCRRPTGSRSARTVADQIRADGKHVVIIGGGDTGADCLGTAHPPGRGVGHAAGDHAASRRRRGRPASRGRPTR